MLRKMMIMAAAVTFVGAMVVSSEADARRGGGFGGGGFRGGGFHGGGFRGGGFHGGFRGGMVRGGFAGPRHFAVRPGFARAGFVRPGFARFHRFHHRRVAFGAVPFAVGVGYGYYGGSCWRWQPTYWGWQRVWVCGYDYGYY